MALSRRRPSDRSSSSSRSLRRSSGKLRSSSVKKQRYCSPSPRRRDTSVGRKKNRNGRHPSYESRESRSRNRRHKPTSPHKQRRNRAISPSPPPATWSSFRSARSTQLGKRPIYVSNDDDCRPRDSRRSRSREGEAYRRKRSIDDIQHRRRRPSSIPFSQQDHRRQYSTPPPSGRRGPINAPPHSTNVTRRIEQPIQRAWNRRGGGLSATMGGLRNNVQRSDAGPSLDTRYGAPLRTVPPGHWRGGRGGGPMRGKPRKPPSPEIWAHDRFSEIPSLTPSKNEKRAVNLYAESFDKLFVEENVTAE